MNIGLDIGGTNIKGVLMKGNKVVARNKVFTKSKSNKKIIITQIFDCIEYLLGKARKVDRIAIGVAGPIDFKKKKVLNPPNVTGLRNTYLAREVEKKFTPYLLKKDGGAILDNDVNCLVLAEAVLGAGRRGKLVVGLGLGTGVGGGIVLNKKVFYGADGSAGEIGHITVNQKGRKCRCGSRGCLEIYTNERGIRMTAKEVFGNEIDTITLHEMAKKGNKKAIKVWEITGKYLGIGLANIVDILNPDIIVIGGGIAGAGEFLLRPARKEMKKNILSPLAKNTKVVRAKLGEYAGAIGAGLLHF